MVRSAEGPASRRWTRMLLCLLFALGLVLHVDHPAPLLAKAETIHSGTTDRLDPCEAGHASAGGHCHAAGACSLAETADVTSESFGRTSTARSPEVEEAVDGRVVGPGFRPPRHLLHV